MASLQPGFIFYGILWAKFLIELSDRSEFKIDQILTSIGKIDQVVPSVSKSDLIRASNSKLNYIIDQ